MPTLIQPTFSKGEIGPALHGRVDTAMYSTALATARNTIIHVYGGASNRPGTLLVGPVKDHDLAPRLIPFHFSTADQYMLEFGHEYMRVIRDDAHVTNAEIAISSIDLADRILITTKTIHGFDDDDEVFFAGVTGTVELNLNRYLITWNSPTSFFLRHQLTGYNVDGTANHSTFVAPNAGVADGTVASIFTLTTPYQAADLPELKYTQSRDVMTLVHTGYVPRDLARTGHNLWTLTKLAELPETSHPVNCFNDTLVSSNNKRIYYGVTAISDATGEESLMGVNGDTATITGITAANPAVVSATAHGFLDGEEVLIADVVGMTLLNDRRFTVVTATANTFELEAEDSSTYDAYISGGTANGVYMVTCKKSISTIDTAEPPEVTFKESHGWSNGDQIWIQGVGGAVEVDNLYHVVSNVGAATADLLDTEGFDRDEVSVYSKVAESDPHGIQTTFTWDAVEGASHYRVYKAEHHIFGFIGEAREPAFTDERNSPDFTDGPPNGANPFRFSGDTPGTTSYYEQRQVFGGSLNSPDTSIYSQTGHRQNFGTSNPVKATDAITASLVSQDVQEIRHYVPMGDLIAFTNSGEWRINSGGDNAFEINTLRQKPQSDWGSSHHRPHKTGSNVVFVEESKARIRALKYTLESDGYQSTDLTLLAHQLFAEDGPNEFLVHDWTFAQFPEPRAYVVRTDGKVCTLTLDMDSPQKVIAWTVWDTKGKFESTASLRRSLDLVEDGVYFGTQRWIDGEPYRFIERLHSRKFKTSTKGKFLDASASVGHTDATSPRIRAFRESDYPGIVSISSSNLLWVEAAEHGFKDGDFVVFEDALLYDETPDDCGDPVTGKLDGYQFRVTNSTSEGFLLATEESVHWTVREGMDFHHYWNVIDGPYAGAIMPNVSPTRHSWSWDGMWLYTFNLSAGAYWWKAPRAWDITAMTGGDRFDAGTFWTPNQPSASAMDLSAMAWNGDGTVMFASDLINSGDIHQYSLSTPYDLRTATYVQKNRPTQTSVVNMYVDETGTRMYILKSGDIHQYSLTSAWDISTLTDDGVSVDFGIAVSGPLEDDETTAFDIKPDGTKMWIVQVHATLGVNVQELTFTTAWDLSTLTYDSIKWNAAPSNDDLLSITDISWKPSGDVMYLSSGNGIFSLEPPVRRIDACLGSYTPSEQWGIKDATHDSGTLTFDGGMRPVYEADGVQIDYTGEITYELNKSPFGLMFDPTDGLSLYVSGQDTANSDNYSIFKYDLATAWELSGATYAGAAFVLDIDADGVDVATNGLGTICFGPSGTTMYVMEYGVGPMMYDLSTAWDVTTAVFNNQIDLTAMTGPKMPGPRTDLVGVPSIPVCMRLKPDGTQMYISDNGHKKIYQYELTTAWDVTTAQYNGQEFLVDGNDDINSSPNHVWDIEFAGTSGTKMYVIQTQDGESSTHVRELNLYTAWDLSTAYYEVGQQLTSGVILRNNSNQLIGAAPRSMRANPDGTRFYFLSHTLCDVGGDDGRAILQWHFGATRFYEPCDWEDEKATLCKLVTVLTGLPDTVEGKTASFLVDGVALTGAVVNHTFTLPFPGCTIYVGLPYCCDIETLNIESPDGTIQGKKDKIAAVTQRYYKSIMPLIGHNFEQMTPVKGRGTELMGEPTQLLSGDNKTILKPHWDSRGRICVRMADPYPLTILAFVPDIIVEDAHSND